MFDVGPEVAPTPTGIVDTDLQLLDHGVGWLRRAVSEERWQWFAAIDNALAVGGAIVDDAPGGTAFLRVADRAGESIVDADLILPPRLSSTRRHRRTSSPASTYRGDVCGS